MVTEGQRVQLIIKKNAPDSFIINNIESKEDTPMIKPPKSCRDNHKPSTSNSESIFKEPRLLKMKRSISENFVQLMKSAFTSSGAGVICTDHDFDDIVERGNELMQISQLRARRRKSRRSLPDCYYAVRRGSYLVDELDVNDNGQHLASPRRRLSSATSPPQRLSVSSPPSFSPSRRRSSAISTSGENESGSYYRRRSSSVCWYSNNVLDVDKFGLALENHIKKTIHSVHNDSIDEEIFIK